MKNKHFYHFRQKKSTRGSQQQSQKLSYMVNFFRSRFQYIAFHKCLNLTVDLLLKMFELVQVLTSILQLITCTFSIICKELET